MTLDFLGTTDASMTQTPRVRSVPRFRRCVVRSNRFWSVAEPNGPITLKRIYVFSRVTATRAPVKEGKHVDVF